MYGSYWIKLRTSRIITNSLISFIYKHVDYIQVIDKYHVRNNNHSSLLNLTNLIVFSFF